VISSPTSAPAVLPSRSSGSSSAFAAVATTEIASESPDRADCHKLIGPQKLAEGAGAAHSALSVTCAQTNRHCPDSKRAT
jgi:hypothetical protein